MFGGESVTRRLVLPLVSAVILLGVTLFSAENIDFSLPSSGKVSLAVYDANGNMVRPLLYGEDMSAGDHRVIWDGLDLHGNPVPAGDYGWCLL